MKLLRKNLLIPSMAAAFAAMSPVHGAVDTEPTVRYGVERVGDLELFFREAGDPADPAIVLLHGFPSSSHMYREVLRALSDSYYLIAPDYPGFGESSFPSPDEFTYSFDNLAGVVDRFLEQRGLRTYSLMIQDYGAPIGFRIATAHPERVQTSITQNGNAYREGISAEGWGPVLLYTQWQQYLRDKQPPVLVVWGRNDAFFPVSGAEGYKRDVKDIDYNILDTGGRGARVQITAAGCDLVKRMWPVYGAAITEHFAQYFSKTELKQLATLLGHLPGVAR